MVDPGRLQIALDSFVKNDPGNNIPGGGKIYSSPCHHYSRIEDHAREIRLKYGYEHSVCGKCQVNVPCEDCIPD